MKKRIATFLLCLALCFTIGGELMLSLFTVPAKADYRQSSDVLIDLKQDSSFNTDNYPVINGSSELKVIQIAETTEGDILVYVYQPNETPRKYTASSINISATTDESLSVKNYHLDLLDYDGVFQKYVVRDLKVLSGTKRSYEVISVYRLYDETIDKSIAPSNGNSLTEVAYKVAKQFTFTNTPEGYTIDVSDIETIDVTDMFVGFLRYPAGYGIWTSKDYQVDSHFVAFSTNYHMDELLEADVYFKRQDVSHRTGDGGKDPEYGEATPDYAYLNSGVDWIYDKGAFVSPTYKWSQITTTQEFLNEAEEGTLYSKGIFFDVNYSHAITEEEKNAFQGKNYVLRFVNTEYSKTYHSSGQMFYTVTKSTIISDVSILRLKFKTNDIVYDLPVISNKQTGSTSPVGQDKYEYETAEWLEKIMSILGLILFCVIVMALWGPISFVLNVLWGLLKLVLKIILKILSLPFKFIGWLFKPK